MPLGVSFRFGDSPTTLLPSAGSIIAPAQEEGALPIGGSVP
jgi:hypothetical protein